jgi:hypothetical protein
MKVCSLTQLKDESSIINHWMDIVGDLVDCMFIVDDNSSDNSVQLIQQHRNYHKVHLLKKYDNLRFEGLGFRLCLEYAKQFDMQRVFISDPDEIPSRKGLEDFSLLLRNTYHPIKLHRFELAIDQKTCHNDKHATGKLVIVNTNDCIFDNRIIHSSQPGLHPSSSEVTLIDSNMASLLHYGPSCYPSQVFKCFSYIIWENIKYNKSFDIGFNEYFKQYSNFVQHGDIDASEYINENAPIPYKKYMHDKQVEHFCKTVDVFNNFNSSIVEKFLQLPSIQTLISNRV